MSSALVLGLLLGAAPAGAMGRRPPEAVSMKPIDAAAQAKPDEWRGAFSAEERPSARMVASPSEWTSLWARSIGRPAPSADLSREVAVAVFLGTRPTGGFGVEFLPPLTDGRGIVFRYRVVPPSPGKYVIEALTRPYAVKLYKDTGLPPTIEEVKG